MSDDQPSSEALRAGRRLVDTLERHEATATIASGDRSVTIGRTSDMGATTYADPETGEIVDVKNEAAEYACKLLDHVWAEVSEQYPVGALTALGIAHKITAAVLTGALAEHKEFLAEPLKPKQTRLEL